MSINSRLTNVIGIKMPFWIVNQLETRSRMASSLQRDNNNLKFVSDKSAWVKLVSSVNVPTGSGQFDYYKTLDPSLKDPEDLARKYVLFGGTSAFKDGTYHLRSGFYNLDNSKGGSYGMLGEDEVNKFGYRPMPGISRATIDTAGRLGAIRQATIEIKCWNKQQLDIIDALYFKLGYTMFLEWGHTFYYENMEKEGLSATNTTPTLKQSELLSIDPFKSGITKEDVILQISKRSRSSYGNYDGMLGMVTNFSFSLNQEGGYDCQLRLMGLGVLGDSLRINNPSNLISIFKDEVLLLSRTLAELNPGEKSANDQRLEELKKKEEEVKKSAEAAKNQFDGALAIIRNNPIYNIPLGPKYFYADKDLFSSVKESFRNENYNQYITTGKIGGDLGGVLYVPALKTFVPLGVPEKVESLDITLNVDAIKNYFSATKMSISDPRSWTRSFAMTSPRDYDYVHVVYPDSLINNTALFEDLKKTPIGFSFNFMPPAIKMTTTDGKPGTSPLYIYNNEDAKKTVIRVGNSFPDHRNQLGSANAIQYGPTAGTGTPVKFGVADNQFEKMAIELYADPVYQFSEGEKKSLETEILGEVQKQYSYLKPPTDQSGLKYKIAIDERIVVLDTPSTTAQGANSSAATIIYQVPDGVTYFGENFNDGTVKEVLYKDKKTTFFGAILESITDGSFFGGIKLVEISRRNYNLKYLVTTFSAVPERVFFATDVSYYTDPPIAHIDPKNTSGPRKLPERFYFTVQASVPIKTKIVASVSGMFNIKANAGGGEQVGTDQTEYTVEVYTEINVPVYLSFTSTHLIKSIDVSSISTLPKDYSSATSQVQTQIAEVEAAKKAVAAQKQAALIQQVNEALSVQSNLETTLRTIEVAALNKSRGRLGNQQMSVVSLTEASATNKKRRLCDVVFSNGSYDSIISDLIDGKVNDDEYYKDSNDWKKFRVRAKYGFATTLMGSDTDESNIEKTFEFLKDRHIDYKDLLRAYVAPYKISANLIEGIQTNHPVYISFGLLLMLLNHSCLLYEETDGATADGATSGKFRKPIVYLDYNTKLNFFQTCPQQMSTNPWVTLMKVECSRSEFAQVFDAEVLDKEDKKIATKIKGQQKSSSEKQTSPEVMIFDPVTSAISKKMPNIKVPGESKNTGYLMNILLNVSYLAELVRDNAAKDGTNGVYLKPFLEEILSAVNKNLGAFNAFRLFYSEKANTFQIIDDQCTYTTIDEMVPAKINRSTTKKTTNTTEIPLYGKYSIAKSMQIKTEMSSKIANMLAISANQSSEQAQNSDNADSIGFISDAYVDRLVPKRLSGGGALKAPNGEIVASQQFNQTIKDFYGTINTSKNDVSQATSFLIDKLSKVKNESPALRGTAMIPLGVEFTTDGISGMSMYQTFTVSDNLLPHTYTAPRQGVGYIDNQTTYVGFVVTGLTHFLESNAWNTTVKSNMVGVKPPDKFIADGVPPPINTAPSEDNPINYELPELTYVEDSTGTTKRVNLSKLDGYITSDWPELAAKFISGNEGFSSKAKDDQGNFRLGYGTDELLLPDGTSRKVQAGDTVDQETAIRMLERDIRDRFYKRVVGSGQNKISIEDFEELNNPQKAALISYTYNCGSLTTQIAAAIRAKNYVLAGKLIENGPRTGAADGKIYDGLVRRRAEEAVLFLAIPIV